MEDFKRSLKKLPKITDKLVDDLLTRRQIIPGYNVNEAIAKSRPSSCKEVLSNPSFYVRKNTNYGVVVLKTWSRLDTCARKGPFLRERLTDCLSPTGLVTTWIAKDTGVPDSSNMHIFDATSAFEKLCTEIKNGSYYEPSPAFHKRNFSSFLKDTEIRTALVQYRVIIIEGGPEWKTFLRNEKNMLTCIDPAWQSLFRSIVAQNKQEMHYRPALPTGKAYLWQPASKDIVIVVPSMSTGSALFSPLMHSKADNAIGFYHQSILVAAILGTTALQRTDSFLLRFAQNTSPDSVTKLLDGEKFIHPTLKGTNVLTALFSIIY